MVSIDRREVQQRDKSGRVRMVTRYKVRYRDRAGRPHSETKKRLVDAERRKAQLELEIAGGTWHDPRRGEIRLSVWAADWIVTRHDLRVTTQARLAVTMDRQVLPKFGGTQLIKITNADVRSWVAEMLEAGLSAATVRKAVFALRQCLAAAIADRRLAINPAMNVPLPSERAKPPQFLAQTEVERLAAEVPERYRALVLVGRTAVFGGVRPSD